jgi:hypothetical protein
MTLPKKNKNTVSPEDMWIISDSKIVDLDLKGICQGVNKTTGKEYEISDLACYMLNPNRIEIKKRLIGCEIQYMQSTFWRIKEKLRQILPPKLQELISNRKIPPEVLLSQNETSISELKDEDLEAHFKMIYELLRPTDSILRRLSKLDFSKVSDVRGICENIDDSRLWLNLQGNVNEKIHYIRNYFLKEVEVILEKAYVSNGLFEMRGFDFEAYEPEKTFRMFIFLFNGKPRCCVLNSNNTVKFWVTEYELIHYMHLLDQSIKTNPRFNESLRQCINGNAKPLVLSFSRQREIDYSKAHLPEIYKEVFETYNIGSKERNVVVNSLNNLQLGISFKYVPKSDSGEGKFFTNISVMHDFKALEPIKHHLPQLYSAIKKRAPESDAGKYYLLDSKRGCEDEK